MSSHEEQQRRQQRRQQQQQSLQPGPHPQHHQQGTPHYQPHQASYQNQQQANSQNQASVSNNSSNSNISYQQSQSYAQRQTTAPEYHSGRSMMDLPSQQQQQPHQHQPQQQHQPELQHYQQQQQQQQPYQQYHQQQQQQQWTPPSRPPPFHQSNVHSGQTGQYSPYSPDQQQQQQQQHSQQVQYWPQQQQQSQQQQQQQQQHQQLASHHQNNNIQRPQSGYSNSSTSGGEVNRGQFQSPTVFPDSAVGVTTQQQNLNAYNNNYYPQIHQGGLTGAAGRGGPSPQPQRLSPPNITSTSNRPQHPMTKPQPLHPLAEGTPQPRVRGSPSTLQSSASSTPLEGSGVFTPTHGGSLHGALSSSPPHTPGAAHDEHSQQPPTAGGGDPNSDQSSTSSPGSSRAPSPNPENCVVLVARRNTPSKVSISTSSEPTNPSTLRVVGKGSKKISDKAGGSGESDKPDRVVPLPDTITPAQVLYMIPKYRHIVTGLVILPSQQTKSYLANDVRYNQPGNPFFGCHEDYMVVVLSCVTPADAERIVHLSEEHQRTQEELLNQACEGVTCEGVSAELLEVVVVVRFLLPPPPPFVQQVWNSTRFGRFLPMNLTENCKKSIALVRSTEKERQKTRAEGDKHPAMSNSRLCLNPDAPALFDRDQSILCKPHFETGECPVALGDECPYRHLTSDSQLMPVPDLLCEFHSSGRACKMLACSYWHGELDVLNELKAKRRVGQGTPGKPKIADSNGDDGYFYKLADYLQKKNPLNEKESRQDQFISYLEGNPPYVPGLTEPEETWNSLTSTEMVNIGRRMNYGRQRLGGRHSHKVGAATAQLSPPSATPVATGVLAVASPGASVTPSSPPSSLHSPPPVPTVPGPSAPASAAALQVVRHIQRGRGSSVVSSSTTSSSAGVENSTTATMRTLLKTSHSADDVPATAPATPALPRKMTPGGTPMNRSMLSATSASSLGSSSNATPDGTLFSTDAFEATQGEVGSEATMSGESSANLSASSRPYVHSPYGGMQVTRRVERGRGRSTVPVPPANTTCSSSSSETGTGTSGPGAILATRAQSAPIRGGLSVLSRQPLDSSSQPAVSTQVADIRSSESDNVHSPRSQQVPLNSPQQDASTFENKSTAMAESAPRTTGGSQIIPEEP